MKPVTAKPPASTSEAVALRIAVVGMFGFVAAAIAAGAMLLASAALRLLAAGGSPGRDGGRSGYPRGADCLIVEA